MDKITENWDRFVGELPDVESGDNTFDVKLKKYLCAIKYISEIKAKIDENTKEEIESNLKKIVDFIATYGKDNYEIGRIKGFKKNKDNQGNWIRNGRDYYFYIADQKMKASVYYIRYLNFLNHIFDEEYVRKLKEEMKAESDASIEVITQNYLKYMLFNNMMREIAFYGGSFQFLWHWNIKTGTLFRCHTGVDPDSNKYTESVAALVGKKYNSKQEFLSIMFKSIVDHMNHPTHVLRSYSLDPYIDIYKYLNVPKENTDERWETITDDGIVKIRLATNTTKSVTFEIVKNVKINTVRRAGGSALDFYSFVQDGNEVKEGEPLSFAVEMYADLPEEGKNEKGTTRSIKPKLQKYLSTWVDDNHVNQIKSMVADDKEVVVYGKIEDSLIDLQQYDINKKNLLYLLLKINEKLNNKQFDYTIKAGTLKKESIFGKENKKWTCEITMDDMSEIGIKTEMEVIDEDKLYGSLDEGKRQSETEQRKVVKKYFQMEIKKFFDNRYKDILNEKNDKADMVLEFMNGYKCQESIRNYNLYDKGRHDSEITLLKEKIFK